MSERKVLNKYYPPDFDPSKIPRLRLSRDRQYTVRLMAPCNMRCTTCGEYIYKGKKFNARKETVQKEEYLGIKIFRFYIKCPRCLAEITFKTDPENADYIVEHGATRNFQALKLAEEAAAKEAKDLEEEEKNNPMKLLENRTKASKQEMDLLETLEELKDLNQRHARVDIESLLEKKRQSDKDALQRQEEEDERYVQSLFRTSDGQRIKRLLDDEEDEIKPSSFQSTSKPDMPSLKAQKIDFVLPKDARKALNDVSTLSEVVEHSKDVPKESTTKETQRTKIAAMITKKSQGIKKEAIVVKHEDKIKIGVSETKTNVVENKTALSLLSNYSDSDDST